MPKANRHKDDPGRLFRAAIPTPIPATTPRIPALKRKSTRWKAASVSSRASFEGLMRQIREDLGYDKTQWNSFRTYCRDAATSARLNWGENWKSQRSDKLSKAYNAIEEAFPETRRFKGQWAIDRTVKQFWDNRKTYRSCVNNKSTYCGRQVAARRAARAATSPRTSPSPLACTSPISPMPGPSRPRRRPPIDSDDDDDDGQGEDVFQPASDEDTEHNRGDEGEDEDEMSEKAKGKRKASA
ncbi:hypothetical protein DFH08DRAFT_966387 [Mycena albidolilacea]|uniref:Uncharacterized protein n=1 Tax=Mycena albidolilacea TaxID=1033008 RepID=A0AAD7EJQ5_9AGAR|nr:hypothetical protein DFH08DRAFT_966387 [Mycena albidolilacea]